MSDPHSHKPATPESHAPEAHDPHVAGDAHHGNHDMHLKLYWGTGIILLCATALTVALSYMDFDKWFKGHGWNMKIGLAVATVKVCLVGAIFMHLKEERSTIWRVLYFTFFFVAGLFLLVLFNWADPIFGTVHSHH
jgi:caa(3)-type oxidase subunit IV